MVTLNMQHASDKERRQMRQIVDELVKRDIEVVHTEIDKSIRVWLLCRTDVSVLKLRKMMKDGGLEDILLRMFSIFLKREVRFTGFLRRLFRSKGQLKMKFSIEPEEFLKAQEYFETFGNQIVICCLF